MEPTGTQNDLQERREDPTYMADQIPRREGGDDSLAEASPEDPRDDEKVLVNFSKKEDDKTFSA